MGFLGFGSRKQSHLVVVTYEGPARLMLNGNRTKDGRHKKHATAYGQTVCWVEFATDGIPTDQGLGPAAGRLPAGEAERLLRELPRNPSCRTVLEHLKEGREQSGRWLKLDKGVPTRETAV